jgi:hypothetical protein
LGRWADGAIRDIDRALHRAIVGPGCLEAQPAFEHAGLIGGHLLKKLRHGIVVSVVLRQLREGENGFECEVALGGGFLLGGGHMKILATNAALIAADPEHPQQREHHGGLAGAVGADEGGQLRAEGHRLRIRPEAAEIGEGQAFKMHDDSFTGYAGARAARRHLSQRPQAAEWQRAILRAALEPRPALR